jgi:hypothetical protein
MAIRLVPFAIAGGSPKKIKTGNVNKEPPPDKVLMIPAKNPTTTNKIPSKSDSISE